MIPELHIALLLSSPRTLALYRPEEGWCLGKRRRPGPAVEELKQSVFLDFWQRYPQFPDHVFTNHWEHFTQSFKPATRGWAQSAMVRLSAEFLTEGVRKVSVKKDRFGDWQNLLGRLSSVPLIAYQLSTFPDPAQAEQFISEIQYSSLIRPDHPVIEDLIAREGLNETHLHLNGTTDSDHVWQEALARPVEHIKDLDQAHTANCSVRDLFAELGLTLKEFKNQLFYAGWLREELWARAAKRQHLLQKFLRPFDRRHCGNNHCVEICMFVILWEELRVRYDPLLDQDILTYLLLRNLAHQLVTQRDDQFGFDQFQKFTATNARDAVEKEYKLRLQQLHGAPARAANIRYLEGRYAAKAKAEELWDLLRNILFGYAQYHKVVHQPRVTGISLTALLERLKSLSLDPCSSAPLDFEQTRAYSRMRLTLICHFVKKKPTKNETEGMTTLYASLRQKVQTQGEVLYSLLRIAPKLKDWVKGMDAAANELDAPPEVFGSVFRALRWAGISHATYHAGEDFNHLLSGMRAVYEAVTFLGLQGGDRIGHATALGLSPKYWIERMPKVLPITRQEWLDSLLFLRSQASINQIGDLVATHFDDQIAQLSRQIYGEYRSPQRLIAAWQVRWVSPKALSVWLAGGDKYSFSQAPLRLCQWEQMMGAEREFGEKALKDHYEWLHSPRIKQKGREFEEIKTDFISADLLFCLQESLLSMLKRKNIVIESLPTSNTRISAYDHLEEHHLFRWIGVEQTDKQSVARVPVCLGSDDPGIFSTDIANEFCHLFGTLTEKYDLTDQKAIEHLTWLNDRGRIFGFHR